MTSPLMLILRCSFAWIGGIGNCALWCVGYHGCLSKFLCWPLRSEVPLNSTVDSNNGEKRRHPFLKKKKGKENAAE
jgi:hypothetical protein